MKPVVMAPNQPKQFYRGGAAIAAFRGTPVEDEFRPEDWVASATSRYNLSPDGLSFLPDGRLLKEAVEADPEAWLGPEHARYFGTSPALLVKLLDAGERLPVHLHPPRSFAYRHLGTRYGKTEAWVVIGTRGAEPSVYLGWSRDVELAELSKLVSGQGPGAILSRLNKLEVETGDALLVPAGTPHAIGEGVFSVELQEPTDFSIMLEFEGFDIDPSGGDLGLGRELALSCVRGHAFSQGELEALRKKRSGPPSTALTSAPEDVFPARANPYFRAQRVHGATGPLAASFAVVVALAGTGALVGGDWRTAVRAGDTLAVPHGAGQVSVEGTAELLRCLPPLAADAAADDPRGSAGGG